MSIELATDGYGLGNHNGMGLPSDRSLAHVERLGGYDFRIVRFEVEPVFIGVAL